MVVVWVLLLPFFLGEGFDDDLFISVRGVSVLLFQLASLPGKPVAKEYEGGIKPELCISNNQLFTFAVIYIDFLLLLFLCSPAMSLGFTILDETFAYVTAF